MAATARFQRGRDALRHVAQTPDGGEEAERAAAVLIERIRRSASRQPSPLRELVVTPALILRESTGPVPA